MYNAPRQYTQYQSPTTLGISERWERVLCYVLGWVTGIIMLLVERRNETVRRHAKQSIVVFGALSVLIWLLGFFGHALGWIPLIGWVFTVGFGFVGGIVGFAGFVAWIGFMIGAAMSARTIFVGSRRDRVF